MNSSAKGKEEIDSSLLSFWVCQLVYVPQLFYRKSSGNPNILAITVVDDFLLAGGPAAIHRLVTDISAKYTIGTIVYSPVSFFFNGVQVRQNTDYSICVDADEKLEVVQPMLINLMRCKEPDMDVEAVELSAYRSVNGSLGWIIVSGSPFF